MVTGVTPSRSGFVGQPASPPALRRERISRNGLHKMSPLQKKAWTRNLTIFVQIGLVVYIVGYQIAYNHDNSTSSSGSNWASTDNELRTLGVSQRSECVPPANQTILEADDLRLSCGAFRLENPPSLDEVFGYLGPTEMAKAKKTKRLIAEFMASGELRVDLGSGTSGEKYNVLPTDLPVVDILNQTKLAALFDEASVSAIRASHVWEHFTYPQAVTAMESIRCLLHPEGVARIATPDAYHPGAEYNAHKLKADFPDGLFNAKYREASYPGHRALWSAHKLAAVAFLTGLNTRPLEWWDSHEILPEQRSFCEQPYDESRGFGIGRSAHHDKRNKENPLTYTSLIVDVMPQKLIEQPWSSSGNTDIVESNK